MFVMQNTLLSFLNSVDMSGSGNVYGYICYRPLNISYQALNVGLWPKIEGFCNLHAKLLVIFLPYNVFSSIDVQTIHSFSLLALYSFACDVPNKYSIMYNCIKKLIVIFNQYTDR